MNLLPGENMKYSLSLLILLSAISFNSTASVEDREHVYSKDSCIDNVDRVITIAFEQGQIYEESGNPDIQPPGAKSLDELYYENYLDTVELYASMVDSPESSPKFVERNNRLNNAIFEAVSLGRKLLESEDQAEQTKLEGLKSSLKIDCI
jgi:hypothetical protein